ncbi:MAG: 3-deoxy-D-manno-octulosonic acid transferase [Parvibaculum sp.]|uniref:3-deoxy-D-manno-octulosonic acid transferase n=1 Tax=Parvibaculum sp. TaxID=2024848 RepID=UPI0025E49AC8|nr:3-deoxy-D-manno-octulosonic acid transferase [Parvibaculum sp.]MCE9648650.1 3-deoxy-D-manno-octulosonic acid transferase [Parvibaculum sp.]
MSAATTQTPGRRPGLGLFAYRLATRAIGPAVPYLLSRRVNRGKEDAGRLNERRGVASVERPAGPLVWIHAASVGESLSVLPLIDGLLAMRGDMHVLVTTGTVTSARLMEERLPPRALHQYAPLDHPDYCARFLAHWRPDLGVWVESEFWPNLIVATHERGTPLALVNARITERSFNGWQRFPATIRDLLGRFSAVLAQDGASAARLRALGAEDVATPGNLKHDAAPLTADAAELAGLRAAIGARPVWLATNTHEGEEDAAADAHALLAPKHPGLLTLIVPRHPARGDAIAASLRKRGLDVAQRAEGETIEAHTDVYLADTLGELGLFYRLADIVFVGGTLVNTGGHNPFEPARLRSALIAGPSDFNFAEAFAQFEANEALIRIADAGELAGAVSALIGDAAMREARAANAERVVTATSDATRKTLQALAALLPPATAEKGAAAHA